jgi:sulfite exporter TauE/SafE
MGLGVFLAVLGLGLGVAGSLARSRSRSVDAPNAMWAGAAFAVLGVYLLAGARQERRP